MGRPQQPELARSAKTDLDPDHVPPENQPGHHPPKEQDKPDLEAMAARLGTDPKAPTATGARKAAHFSAPQPAPEEQGESRLVGLILLPLRQTVKHLDQLDRTLTERLDRKVRSVRGGRGPRGR